jgi:glycosyltransferase involved in cell wall biosynthesis
MSWPYKVSIIILAHNRAEKTWKCLNSLVKNTPEELYQLVLIDDASIDETSQLFLDTKEIHKDTIIYTQPSNLGVTPGRIKGIELGTGNIKMFLDDDCIIYNSAWLPYLIEPFRDIQVGVTGQAGNYITQFGLWAITHADKVEVDCVQGYCMCFREIGLTLDPAYGKFWHEESDFCLQYKEAGYKILSRPYAGIYHSGDGSGNDGTYWDKLTYFTNKWKDKPNLLVPVNERIIINYW